jgi:hypothetical protein
LERNRNVSHQLSLEDQIKADEMDRACCMYCKGVPVILLGTSEVNRLLIRTKHIWEGMIKMDIEEIRCKGVSRTLLHEDRDQWKALAKVVINLLVL